ncbi:hypothetical protein BD779DRAFT_1474428 [Infundibulicybe gibba]|nr:hypothetical protein BD779DRAFT_1474428 [Infundibulicybe gibba]
MENLGVTLRDFSALLPNLRSLTCPPLLMSLLAPGRPLTHVKLHSRSNPSVNVGAILGFYDPKNTIIELSIPPITTDEAPATNYFPCLRKVVLRLPLPDPRHYKILAAGLKSLIVNSCSRWAGNPSIQQVVIPTNVFVEYLVTNLALQHAILVEILSHAFPALLRFQLDECVVWERFAVSDAWRVLLVAKHRAGLVARFEAGDPGVVDYDGYLQRLSRAAPQWRINKEEKKGRKRNLLWYYCALLWDAMGWF